MLSLKRTRDIEAGFTTDLRRSSVVHVAQTKDVSQIHSGLISFGPSLNNLDVIRCSLRGGVRYLGVSPKLIAAEVQVDKWRACSSDCVSDGQHSTILKATIPGRRGGGGGGGGGGEGRGAIEKQR